ncbi:hypothetical protein GHT06_014601 [Daphnia sinensis]|uniref:Secreted protein n=1 Tax=Daphnia sinensis TaxID=1820382 RepID=A0AAD5PS51_9CRUS|nr:hypothetical protein GHT06_014601 [Daphnia sinensis]
MKVLVMVAIVLVLACAVSTQLPDGWNYNLFLITFFSLVRALPLGLEPHTKTLATCPEVKRKETQDHQPSATTSISSNAIPTNDAIAR